MKLEKLHEKLNEERKEYHGGTVQSLNLMLGMACTAVGFNMAKSNNKIIRLLALPVEVLSMINIASSGYHLGVEETLENLVREETAAEEAKEEVEAA